MTIEERVKMLVGDLMVSVQMLNATIEEQRQKIVELEAKLNGHREPKAEQ